MEISIPCLIGGDSTVVLTCQLSTGMPAQGLEPLPDAKTPPDMNDPRRKRRHQQGLCRERKNTDVGHTLGTYTERFPDL